MQQLVRPLRNRRTTDPEGVGETRLASKQSDGIGFAHCGMFNELNNDVKQVFDRLREFNKMNVAA
ncbi:hypothetical protein [Amantichitinum ursilacus]|uniref:hypothetical protein n=1 Tax=Amantichitinum ursilacus TaxID=857265 RepID=UPI001F22766E|nr:hypothetical protein [Amantichitinum ursilacus]